MFQDGQGDRHRPPVGVTGEENAVRVHTPFFGNQTGNCTQLFDDIERHTAVTGIGNQ